MTKLASRAIARLLADKKTGQRWALTCTACSLLVPRLAGVNERLTSGPSG
jgi:hypothetical protein